MGIMNRSFIRIGLVALVLVGGINILAQSRQTLAEAQRITGDRFSFVGSTPRGANVYAVDRPSADLITAIDKGLTDLFATARRNGYSRGLSYSNFTVYIGRADRTRNSNGGYSPDIAVGAAQYAGSVYDQGGFVYAAGMVISNSPGAFVIAEHNRDFQRVADVVRYEGEHIVLFHNDRRRYNETADHSQGGGHPILR